MESESCISEGQDRLTLLKNQISKLQQKLKALNEHYEDSEIRSPRDNISYRTQRGL